MIIGWKYDELPLVRSDFRTFMHPFVQYFDNTYCSSNFTVLFFLQGHRTQWNGIHLSIYIC